MSNKEKSAESVGKVIDAFRCPHCQSPMQVVDFKSLVCSNRHTFDFAKQGYVNLMTHATSSHYDKTLFESRRQIIMESGLYASLHEKISTLIKSYRKLLSDRLMIFDAGCGEGSHLQRILNELGNESISGVGLDISKEGIVMAAKNYRDPIWIVGDLAQSPLADQSFHVILNILSPANYKDFKRVLVPNGLVIKVVPRANYLKELRDTLFHEVKKKVYKNDETVSLFQKHFHLADVSHLSYTKSLEQTELVNLVQMSPLGWTSDKEHIDLFTNQESAEITVDLDILVGVNTQ